MASNGHLSDILIKIKAAINANSSFTTALVFKREELESDELDMSKVNIFAFIESERPHVMPMVVDFRVYRVRVVLWFAQEGRSLVETADDTLLENKSIYNDALQTALKTTNAGQTYAISNVYQTEYVSTDWNYDNKGKSYDNGTARAYRISQTYDFYTYES